MPASSGDPISAALNHSLAASSKFSCDEENLDTKLIGSAKRVLLSEIKYEQTSSYSSNLIDLKSKYIVLKPTGNVENNEFKLKNGLGLPKVKDNSNELKTSQGGSPKVSNVNNSSNSVAGSTSKSDSVLPSPKRVLFPPEKIQLGWQSKSQPVGSGMVNMGNTCYLNSTLQALFHVPAFVNWLLNDKAHKDKCENMNGLTQMENSCLICAVQKTLKNSMENSALNNAIRPHLVYSKLKLICKRLMHGHQEDAHEFLRYLIESMDRSYLKIMRASELDSYSKETSPLSQIFGGYLRTEVRCLECRNISVTFQHFQDMLLDIRQASAVNEALEAYFSRESLGDGDESGMYKCDKCHSRVQATKQFSVEKPPNVLCIQLKRFGIMGGKNSKHINIQQSLDLTKFWVHRQSQPQSKLIYRLVSLVSHIGPSTNCGHYTAIGNTASGQFYVFDDSSVRPISSHNVSGNNTYIIMYELTSPNPSLNGTPTKLVGASCTVTKPSQPSTSFNVNGTKCPPSPLTNGNSTLSKLQHSTTPKSPSKLNHSGPSSCTKNSSQSSTPASPRKSLVPYSTESSDSESEPNTNNTSKNGHSTPLSPLKNGFAKESTSCAKSSNCVAPGKATKTSGVGVGGVSVVNGWKVTKVDKCRNGVVTSPPPNWDVVDTADNHKLNGKSEDSSPSKASSLYNGSSPKDAGKPTMTNGNGYNGHSHNGNGHNGYNGNHNSNGHNGHHSSENGRDESKKMSNGIHENGRMGNGKSWDGNRNNTTVEYLRKNSHQGYGPNVTSWNGNKSQIDREVENDRTLQQRKRNYDQMYDEDFDQGKIKKMKSNNHYQKNVDRDGNGRPRNYFQEQQNYKNNNWHNRSDRSHFYRTYVSSGNYRTYNNNNRHSNSSYYYRR